MQTHTSYRDICVDAFSEVNTLSFLCFVIIHN